MRNIKDCFASWFHHAKATPELSLDWDGFFKEMMYSKKGERTNYIINCNCMSLNMRSRQLSSPVQLETGNHPKNGDLGVPTMYLGFPYGFPCELSSSELL